MIKARNIPLASKLRELLTDVLELEKLTSDELSKLYDEVIVQDDSPRDDTVVHGLKVLMANYLHLKLMSSDEIQILVDEAINMYQVKHGLKVVPVVAGFMATGLEPASKNEIN